MRRRVAVGFALAFLPLLPPHARAVEYVAGFTPYCRAFSAPGGIQEITLAVPVPAGHSVHVGVVTSANVTLTNVTDVSGNSYVPVVSGSAGGAEATLLAAQIANPLPTGDSIEVAIAATSSGSSCVSAFEATEEIELDRTGFAVGSGVSASLDLAPLGADGEIVHALLFGAPTGPNSPVVTREPPLVAITGGCVGTSSGPMCSFPSYAEVPSAGEVSLSHSLTHGLNWGLIAASFVPEPGADSLGLASLLALVQLRRASGRRRSGLP